MLCRRRFASPHTIGWGPIVAISVATGCVPEIPVPDEPDGGVLSVTTERDGLESTPTVGDGGGSDAFVDQAVEDSGMGAGPAAMDEMVETMPYLCQADSDCAESLVCQNEECVFVPPERVPATTVQTIGGGVVTGSGLRLQLRIGAPSPVGRVSGSDRHLILGPLAGH